MKTKRYLPVLGILLVLLAQAGCAEVGFDDFSVTVDPEEINVSGSFEVNMTFEAPTDTDSVTVKLEILVDGVTVFLDEDYDIHFSEDEDKSEILSSDDDFPGPDLESDYFNDNLMNYACGDVKVEARVSGDDLDDEYSDETTLTIGADAEDLSFEMDPSDPKPADEITFTVFDEDDDEMKGAKVKVTWLNDSDGNEDGKWDSEDAKYEGTTNSRGERMLIIEDQFKGDNVEGKFQVDVYASGYCLERKTFDVSSGKLVLSYSPTKPAVDESISICAKDAKGNLISGASTYVYGPSYSKTYTTDSSGCISIKLPSLGTYRATASKDGYTSSLETLIYVGEKATTTTTTSTTTTEATTRATTTTTKASEKLFIYLSDMTPHVNDTVDVTVKDAQNRPVKGITVTVSPTGVKGKTNDDGVFSFTVEDPGAYSIIASSDTSVYASTSESIQATNPPAPEKPSGGEGINPILILVVGIALIVLLAIAVVVVLLLKGNQTKKPKKKDWSANKPERWISLKDDAKEE